MDATKQTYTWAMARLPSVSLVAAVAVAAAKLYEGHRSGDLHQFFLDLSAVKLSADFEGGVRCDGCTPAVYLWAVGVLGLLAALVTWWLTSPRPTYLVDYSVWAGDASWEFPKERFLPTVLNAGVFDEGGVEFMRKIVYRSGLGDHTCVPPWLTGVGQPPVYDMEHARMEFEITVFEAVQDLLQKTGVQPRQIGVVIVNSSLFNPTPSLAASVMNHFKMPSSTINYNLGGMGCSAGLVSLDLARQCLAQMPNSYVLVVSCENITRNWYAGSQKSMLIPNCIFRSNAAAMLLSNRPGDAWGAKYSLRHLVRTNMASNDTAYGCVYEQEDEAHHRGVKLSKELMGVAGQALKANMTALGPLVLPLSEKLLFAAHLVKGALLGRTKGAKPFVPDFALAFEHICIHTGGRAVIDAMEAQLSLSRDLVEPSRATLYRCGNVSSASIWYGLAYVESLKGVARGDRVWQLSFGSGFKCNSAVWVANRRIKEVHSVWEGFDPAKMWTDLAEMDEREGLAPSKH